MLLLPHFQYLIAIILLNLFFIRNIYVFVIICDVFIEDHYLIRLILLILFRVCVISLFFFFLRGLLHLLWMCLLFFILGVRGILLLILRLCFRLWMNIASKDIIAICCSLLFGCELVWIQAIVRLVSSYALEDTRVAEKRRQEFQDVWVRMR